MVPDATLQQLSSLPAGGSPAKISLTTTGGVTLTVDPLVSVIKPSGDTTATTWQPSYDLAGVETATNAASPTILELAGTNLVDVHLTGTKAGSDKFANGNYIATVTVRCE